MIFFFGTSDYGSVGRVDDVVTVTSWLHVFGVPLVPLGSRVDWGDRSTRIPLQGRSIGVTVLRTWPLWVAAFVFGIGFPATWVSVVVTMLWIPGVAASVLLARPSLEARARRLCYAEIVGFPIDVVHLVNDNDRRDALTRFVEKRTPELTEMGYREAVTSWVDPVKRGLITDREVLVAALTLSRFERAAATSPSRRRDWDAVGNVAFAALSRVDPEVMARARKSALARR